MVKLSKKIEISMEQNDLLELYALFQQFVNEDKEKREAYELSLYADGYGLIGDYNMKERLQSAIIHFENHKEAKRKIRELLKHEN